MRKYRIFGILTIILACISCFGASNYTIVEFPWVLDSDKSELVCISDNLWVCGYIEINSERTIFTSSPEGEYKEVFNLPFNAKLIAINNLGQITGNYKIKNETHGFFWDPNTGWQDLGHLGGKNTVVSDMNNKGYVVGYSITENIKKGWNNRRKKYFTKPEAGSIHAFLWKSGKMIDIGALANKMESRATSINDMDIVIGICNRKNEKINMVKWSVEKRPQMSIFRATSFNPLESHCLTKQGWFCVDNLIINSSTFEVKEVSHSISGIANGCFGFSNLDGGTIFNENIDGTFKTEKIFYNSNSYWQGLSRLNSMNSQGDIVGCAKTHTGEEHAILLLKN